MTISTIGFLQLGSRSLSTGILGAKSALRRWRPRSWRAMPLHSGGVEVKEWTERLGTVTWEVLRTLVAATQVPALTKAADIVPAPPATHCHQITRVRRASVGSPTFTPHHS